MLSSFIIFGSALVSAVETDYAPTDEAELPLQETVAGVSNPLSEAVRTPEDYASDADARPQAMQNTQALRRHIARILLIRAIRPRHQKMTRLMRARAIISLTGARVMIDLQAEQMPIALVAVRAMTSFTARMLTAPMTAQWTRKPSPLMGNS